MARWIHEFSVNWKFGRVQRINSANLLKIIHLQIYFYVGNLYYLHLQTLSISWQFQTISIETCSQLANQQQVCINKKQIRKFMPKFLYKIDLSTSNLSENLEVLIKKRVQSCGISKNTFLYKIPLVAAYVCKISLSSY